MRLYPKGTSVGRAQGVSQRCLKQAGRFTPMLVTAFAPTLLNPLGHGVVELHRLLTDLQVQAFTVSQHYDGRLATMPSADFCLITQIVTHPSATG